MRQFRWGGRSPSHQAKLAKLAPQRFGHGGGTLGDFVEVAWSILGSKIAPALKCAMRPRLDQNHFGLEHDAATPDPILIDEGTDRAHPLAAHDFAANDQYSEPPSTSSAARLGTMRVR